MSKPSRASAAFMKSAAIASLYPTLSNVAAQSIWIDCDNKCYTDDGSTAAADGDSVKTILLPSGWDKISVGGKVTQATGSKRPTKRAGAGIQVDGVDDFMFLPASLVFTGNFALWIAYYTPDNSKACIPFGQSTGSNYDSVWCCGAAGSQAFLAGTTSLSLWANAGNLVTKIMRFRRVGSNAYMDTDGVSETVGVGIGTATITLDMILARVSFSTFFSDSVIRFRQIVGYADTVVPADANDTKVVTAIQGFVSGVAGP